MATQSINPVTTEERLIWFGLVATYPIYFLGGLYVSGSVLGYLILAVLLLRLFVEGNQNTHRSVPAMAWLWIVAMLVMLQTTPTDDLLGSAIGWIGSYFCRDALPRVSMHMS